MNDNSNGMLQNQGTIQLNGITTTSGAGILSLDPTGTLRDDCSGVTTDFFGPITVNGPSNLGNCPKSVKFDPKIGIEVVVAFIEGDPDQPILVTPPASGIPPGVTAPAGWYQIGAGGLTSGESTIVSIAFPFSTSGGSVYKFCTGSAAAPANDASRQGHTETIVQKQAGQGDCGSSTGIIDPQAILVPISIPTPVFPLGTVLGVLARFRR